MFCIFKAPGCAKPNNKPPSSVFLTYFVKYRQKNSEVSYPKYRQ